MVEVPLADHHGVVSGGGEGFGDGGAAGEFGAAGLVAVESGEQRDTGGVALGGVVELGEAEAFLGEGVELGGFDFGTVATDVREAEVVGHDEDDVWLLASRDRSPEPGAQTREEDEEMFHGWKSGE